MLRPQPEKFVSATTKQAFCLLVGINEAIEIDVKNQDGLGRLLDQKTEPRLTGEEVFLDLLALGDFA